MSCSLAQSGQGRLVLGSGAIQEIETHVMINFVRKISSVGLNCILNLNMIPMLEVRGVNLHESLSCLRLTWDAKMWWNVEIFRRAKFLGLQIWV